MAKNVHQFEYEIFDSEAALPEADRYLLQKAREHTANAYAPYSHFRVAAVARTMGGHIVKGTNQENASYPVGICAERVLLSTLSSLYPDDPVETIAISYHNMEGDSGSPVSPCGMCRQSLVEYEYRLHHPIRLVLAGQDGKVLVVKKAKDLLPFTFTPDDLK
jgi:cytidine deaminase